MADYSTYLTIINQISSDIKLIDQKATLGSWAIPPPEVVRANSTSIQFRCEDASGSNGSDGWIQYGTKAGLENLFFQINFGDPYSGNNYISTNGFSSNLYTLSYRAKSDGQWFNNSCPTSGH